MKILFLIFLCVSTLWAHKIAGVSLDSVDVVYEEKLKSDSLRINLKFVSPGKLERISVRGNNLFFDIKKDELSVLDGILICGMWVKKSNRSYEVYFDTPQPYTKGVLFFNGNESYKIEKKERRSRKEPGQLPQIHSKENTLSYTPSDSDLHIKSLLARYDVSPVIGKFVIKKENEEFIKLQTRDKFFQFSSSTPTSYFSLKEIERNTTYYLMLDDYSVSFKPF